MTNTYDTLRPRPAALTGPISTTSADTFLGLESDHGDGSRRSSRDEFVDLENGNGQGPSAERDEPSTNQPIVLLISSSYQEADSLVQDEIILAEPSFCE